MLRWLSVNSIGFTPSLITLRHSKTYTDAHTTSRFDLDSCFVSVIDDKMKPERLILHTFFSHPRSACISPHCQSAVAVWMRRRPEPPCQRRSLFSFLFLFFANELSATSKAICILNDYIRLLLLCSIRVYATPENNLESQWIGDIASVRTSRNMCEQIQFCLSSRTTAETDGVCVLAMGGWEQMCHLFHLAEAAVSSVRGGGSNLYSTTLPSTMVAVIVVVHRMSQHTEVYRTTTIRWASKTTCNKHTWTLGTENETHY